MLFHRLHCQWEVNQWTCKHTSAHSWQPVMCFSAERTPSTHRWPLPSQFAMHHQTWFIMCFDHNAISPYFNGFPACICRLKYCTNTILLCGPYYLNELLFQTFHHMPSIIVVLNWWMSAAHICGNAAMSIGCHCRNIVVFFCQQMIHAAFKAQFLHCWRIVTSIYNILQ